MALLIAPALLHGQQHADSAVTAARPVFDRYTIDVAAIVRDGVPRTLSDLLVGRVPGLLVTPGSGLHGSGTRIRFAGLQSLLADAPPLVLVDDMYIDGREDDSQIGPGPSRLDDISVEDVETIDVVRGPASTAIYGQGAAAGVILIHTKAGHSGRIRMAGFAQSAMQSIPARWPANYGGVDLDNADPYMRIGACNLQAQASGSCVQDYVQRFNPLVQRSPFSDTPDRLVGLSATGGPSWGTVRLAGTFDGEPAAYNIPSVTWSDDIRQWNLRASGEFHPRSNIGLGLSIARTASSLHLANYAPISQGLLGPSDSTGFSWDQGLPPPGLQTIGRTVVNLNGHASVTSWLTLQGTLGFDDLLQREQQLTSPLVSSTGRRRGGEHTLRFMATVPDRKWRGIRFSSTLGFERRNSHGEEIRSIVQQNSSFFGQSIDQLRWIGLYGVEQITLRDRVVLTGTLRHDWFHGQALGQLATGGTHPSVALDWIARPERNGTLGRLAVRASYGTSAAAPARVIETFSLVPPPLGQASPPPPPLEPEKTRAFEVGAEATGFAARVHAQLSFYDSRSQAIEPLPPSIPSGGPSPLYVSGAVIGNRGVVASVMATLIDRTDLGWDLHVSLWGNRNRLLEWPGPPTFFAASGIRTTGQLATVGYPTGGYWARPVTGFSDANGDGIITSNEVTYSQTFQWMGTPYPTQGATLNTSWRLGKRVRVSTLLDYRAGQTLYNRIADFRCEASLCRERNDPTTPLAAQAIAVAAGASPPDYYEDADYLKLREISLAFDVPDRVAAAVGARNATIVIGGRNLATWTGYSGADPEAGSYGISSIGAPPIIADFGTVPTARVWTLRVRLSY